MFVNPDAWTRRRRKRIVTRREGRGTEAVAQSQAASPQHCAERVCLSVDDPFDKFHSEADPQNEEKRNGGCDGKPEAYRTGCGKAAKPLDLTVSRMSFDSLPKQ